MIAFTAYQSQGSLATFCSIDEFTFVFIAVFPQINAFTCACIRCEVSCVRVTVGEVINTDAVLESFFEVPFVFITVRVEVCAFAVELAIGEVSFVSVTVW